MVKFIIQFINIIFFHKYYGNIIIKSVNLKFNILKRYS